MAVPSQLRSHTESVWIVRALTMSGLGQEGVLGSRNHLDCYLHGCPCGYFGDPRRACSCAPGPSAATSSGSQQGPRWKAPSKELVKSEVGGWIGVSPAVASS